MSKCLMSSVIAKIIPSERWPIIISLLVCIDQAQIPVLIAQNYR